MPPRLPTLGRSFNSTLLCFRPAPTASCTPLSITAVAHASSKSRKSSHKDPYAIAQAKQRKLANQARQEELRKHREEALGDPIRGITTPFLESLDTVGGSSVILGVKKPDTPSSPESADNASLTVSIPSNIILNHYLKADEVQHSIQNSYSLTAPLISENRDSIDPVVEAAAIQKHQDDHARATLSIARIVSLANASQADRTRVNVQRCIEEFGRHNTDKLNSSIVESDIKTPRAGPDTGSSEVQIAILTTKIRALGAQLAAHGGNRDKANKRNMKLLVHRRQRLLKYLRRKERGNERWQRLVTTLGLTDGTWVGEITHL